MVVSSLRLQKYPLCSYDDFIKNIMVRWSPCTFEAEEKAEWFSQNLEGRLMHFCTTRQTPLSCQSGLREGRKMREGRKIIFSSWRETQKTRYDNLYAWTRLKREGVKGKCKKYKDKTLRNIEAWAKSKVVIIIVVCGHHNLMATIGLLWTAANFEIAITTPSRRMITFCSKVSPCYEMSLIFVKTVVN